jgi:hypothetical protein
MGLATISVLSSQARQFRITHTFYLETTRQSYTFSNFGICLHIIAEWNFLTANDHLPSQSRLLLVCPNVLWLFPSQSLLLLTLMQVSLLMNFLERITVQLPFGSGSEVWYQTLTLQLYFVLSYEAEISQSGLHRFYPKYSNARHNKLSFLVLPLNMHSHFLPTSENNDCWCFDGLSNMWGQCSLHILASVPELFGLAQTVAYRLLVKQWLYK